MTDAACLSLTSVLSAMVAAGCSDQQIAFVVRRFAGETVVTETVAPPPTRPAAPATLPTVGEGEGGVPHVPVRPLAVFRAGLNAHRGLSRGAARVGAAILDCYDAKTGLCAVGTDRLGAVTRLSRASVFRALKALEAAGLFVRLSYQGIGHCNAYRPALAGAMSNMSYSLISETVEARKPPRTVSDRLMDETHSQREIKTPSLPGGESEGQNPKRRAKGAGKVRGKVRGKGRAHMPDPRQREMRLLREDPKTNAAEAERARRLAAMARQAAPIPVRVPPVLLGRVLWSDTAGRKASERLFVAWDHVMGGNGAREALNLDRNPDPDWFAAWDAGVCAERQVRGSGWAAFEAESDRRMALKATGPPVAKTG